MSAFPAIAPRLVFHSADVESVLRGLGREHSSLCAELQSLETELEALARALPAWDVDEAVAHEAVRALEVVYGERRATALALLDAERAAGEQAAAERVAIAEREAADQLAQVRAEVGDRLIEELELDGPMIETPIQDAPHPAVSRSSEPTPEDLDRTPSAEPGSESTTDEGPQGAAWNDGGAETDRFRTFWSEHDEVASVREAIAAPLVAIVPMVLALLVIFLLLVIVI